MEYFSTLMPEWMMFILNYQNSIRTSDNLTLSIDNIVINFSIKKPQDRDDFMVLLSNLSTANVVNWSEFRPGTYREQFSVRMEDGTSFWLGIGLNTFKTKWESCRIDFNPNKVAKHVAFQEILQFLISTTHDQHREVKRFDLAIDIPVERHNCFLVKDRRLYSERAHGQEWTQYLGKASHVGHVKLYNKQIESHLSHPLTRLELTLDPVIPYEKVNFPTVYYLNDLQMVFDEVTATDTERFILNALLHNVGSPKDLGRKARKRLEMLMGDYVKRVEISSGDFNTIISQLCAYSGTTLIPKTNFISACAEGDYYCEKENL